MVKANENKLEDKIGPGEAFVHFLVLGGLISTCWLLILNAKKSGRIEGGRNG